MYFFYVVVCVRGVGGVGEYCYMWFDVEGNGGICRLNCDFCQLFCGWVWVDCVVVVNVNLFWQQYKEYRRDQGVIWCCFNKLQWWMDGVGGGMNCVGNQVVDFVLFQYQCVEYYVVFQLFVGNWFGYVFVFMQFNQVSDIVFMYYFWIDDFNICVQFNVLRCCDVVDFIWVVQQYVSGDVVFSVDCCCFDGMWFVVFWQYYVFIGFMCQFGQLVVECWWREMMVMFGSGGQ